MRKKIPAGLLGLAAAILAGAPAQSQSTLCPSVFQPVCGVFGDGSRQDFGNACQANAAGAAVIIPGRCSASPRSEGMPLPWPMPWKRPGGA